MKLISSSTARRRTANAALGSLGGPQMPSPVRRIAPKPRRCTEISPPSEISPAKLAESSFLFTIDLQNSCVTLSYGYARVQQSQVPLKSPHGTRHSKSELLFLAQRTNVANQIVNLRLAQRTLEGRHSALAVGNDLSEFRIGPLLDCV